jgi:hypothetical protein
MPVQFVRGLKKASECVRWVTGWSSCSHRLILGSITYQKRWLSTVRQRIDCEDDGFKGDEQYDVDYPNIETIVKLLDAVYYQSLNIEILSDAVIQREGDTVVRYEQLEQILKRPRPVQRHEHCKHTEMYGFQHSLSNVVCGVR